METAAGVNSVTSVTPHDERRAKLGIRSKLFLVSLALIGVALIAAEFYLSRTLEAQLNEGIRADLLVRARLVAQRVAESPARFDNLVFYDALADSLGTTSGVRVTLVRPDGTVFGDSEVDAAALPQVENHGARPEIIAATGQGEGASVRFSSTIHERLMYVAAPIMRNGTPAGVARVAMPLTRIDEALARLHKTLAAGALFALAVAGIVSWLAAQLISRKLRDLTLAARSMAAGNLATRTRVGGRDEIGALGNALDQLAQSLSRSLDELRGERDLLNGILASMAEGVLVVTRDGRIALSNAALKTMFLVTGDPVGKYVLHVIRNADLNEILNQAARGEVREMELELSGLRPRRVLVRASALHGAPAGVLAVFVDVTELRRLEAVRRDFVANASHELRSPLTTVRAAAETLASVKEDPEAAGRFIELISRNAERLENLVNDMLELSRIESRELQMHLEALDLAPLADRVVQQHQHRAEVKQIRFEQDVAGAPRVRVDRRALEHVLGNLVDNAIKYCPAGSTVGVKARVDEGIVHVDVSDNGPGIPAEHLPRLFERFYRVDPGRSRELGGTGLGLSIVKHLVEAMGGTVSVASRAGAGSTFSFTLKKA